jgi:hypothetical protein
MVRAIGRYAMGNRAKLSSLIGVWDSFTLSLTGYHAYHAVQNLLTAVYSPASLYWYVPHCQASAGLEECLMGNWYKRERLVVTAGVSRRASLPDPHDLFLFCWVFLVLAVILKMPDVLGIQWGTEISWAWGYSWVWHNCVHDLHYLLDPYK